MLSPPIHELYVVESPFYTYNLQLYIFELINLFEFGYGSLGAKHNKDVGLYRARVRIDFSLGAKHNKDIGSGSFTSWPNICLVERTNFSSVFDTRAHLSKSNSKRKKLKDVEESLKSKFLTRTYKKTSHTTSTLNIKIRVICL